MTLVPTLATLHARDWFVAGGAALPWILAPALAWARLRRSRSLDAEPLTPPKPSPLVSVIVPARNEARNIEACVRSILATSYPALELIVIDDHSTDGTADLARAIADADSRLRVVANPPLPEGWFGKQWACATGASLAGGEILLFADADTRHAPDLVVRAVNAMQTTAADLFSVAGRQELGTFAERIVQPQVFGMLAARYGGTESVDNARRAADVIANGQCLFMTRGAYDAVGGHARVRHKVAEDLALAQAVYADGGRVRVRVGVEQLSTRMYESLSELVRGWRKNVFAGGRDAMPAPPIVRAVLYPVALLAWPLDQLVPVAALALALLGLAGPVMLLWALLTVAATVVWWIAAYALIGERPWLALLYPLGALVVLYIFVTAIARGSRVGWKGREYTSR